MYSISAGWDEWAKQQPRPQTPPGHYFTQDQADELDFFDGTFTSSWINPEHGYNPDILDPLSVPEPSYYQERYVEPPPISKPGDFTEADYDGYVDSESEEPVKSVNPNQSELANEIGPLIFQQPTEIIDDDEVSGKPEAPTAWNDFKDSGTLWANPKADYSEAFIPPEPMEAIAEEATKKIYGGAKHGGGLSTGSSAMLAGSHLLSGMMQGASTLGATAMKDNTDTYMQQQAIQQQQWETNTNNAFKLQYQQTQFSNDSSLLGQNYTQQSQLMSQELQQSEDYYNFQMGQTTNALQQAGLPTYLAYIPGAAKAQPAQTQFTSGGTTYTAKIAGNPTSVPYTGTPQQVAAGYGNVSSAPANTMP